MNPIESFIELTQFSKDFMTKKEKIDDSFSKDRMKICKECDSFVKSIAVCNECGCFMKIKTKWKDASCPKGKW